MPIAISPNERHEYIVEAERELEPEFQTVFTIRTLDGIEATNCLNRQGTFETFSEAVRLGLCGWANFKDAKGVEVPFTRKGNGVAHESLRRIDPATIVELGSHIITLSKPEREDLGK